MHIPFSNLRLVTFPAILALGLYSPSGSAETMLTTERDAGIYISDVRMAGTDIQGEIVNQTGATVVGAELLVRHQWMWADETNPGTDDPGWIEAHPLNVNIPAGQKAPFNVQSSRAAPQRSDGTFRTQVSVRSFETTPSQ